MPRIERQRIGVTGVNGEIPVYAEVFVNGSKYKVQVAEVKGKATKVPMSAEGLPDIVTAHEMLSLFVENYKNMQAELKGSLFKVAQEKLEGM